MAEAAKNSTFAVFPFLKTSGPVRLGRLTFRATDDAEGLTTAQASWLADIGRSLFLQDDLRIKSGTYGIVDSVDLERSETLEPLVNAQAVVAYLYAGPRHSFGDLFLSAEHASMALLTPQDVPRGLVWPDHHVEVAGPQVPPEEGTPWQVPGFFGMYNFCHPFWMVPGSRLYGPKPHLSLNGTQDLKQDLEHSSDARPDYRLLSELLGKPVTKRVRRLFAAVRWFNTANLESSDSAHAIVALSIAFEALLGLPRSEKTDRFVDAIALLLGRVDRLDVWARQFYDVRSKVVHEGEVDEIRFVATDAHRDLGGPRYQSLLPYGRRIFQMCLATLLVGADLADAADLKETFWTNQERFQRVCSQLSSDDPAGARERLECAWDVVSAAKRYRYVNETGLEPGALLGAVKRAAATLLLCDDVGPGEWKPFLERVVAARKTRNELDELEALCSLHDVMKPGRRGREEADHVTVMRELVDLAWNYVGLHYHWLKRQATSGDSGKPGPGTSSPKAP